MPTRVTLLGFVNAWLVPEDDGLTLIDTTMGPGAKKILKAAAELGQPITRIALTHGHSDHVGGLDRLAAELPGVEVLISARDARLLDGDTSLDEGESGRKITGGVSATQTKPTRTIAAGDLIGSLQVIAAPGHTPGHVAFLDPRDGTLFCGDAYTTFGGTILTSAKASLPFPLAAGATWDRAVELQTAKDLRALEPKALAPGHGKLVTAPLAGMDAAIAKAS